MSYVGTAVHYASKAHQLFEIGRRIATTLAGICIAGAIATAALIVELIGLDTKDEDTNTDAGEEPG